MKTAEDYLKEVEHDIHFYGGGRRNLLAAINEARKEAIEECAKKVWFEPVTAKEILSLLLEIK